MSQITALATHISTHINTVCAHMHVFMHIYIHYVHTHIDIAGGARYINNCLNVAVSDIKKLSLLILLQC